jgi:hypothetical protein
VYVQQIDCAATAKKLKKPRPPPSFGDIELNDRVLPLKGLTALSEAKAPFLNWMTDSPFVVQPSGKIVIGGILPFSPKIARSSIYLI